MRPALHIHKTESVYSIIGGGRDYFTSDTEYASITETKQKKKNLLLIW